MPVTSSDFLLFAKDCITRSDEIGYRNAIARAYYAAYHHVLPCMLHGPKDNHQGLIDYLKGDAWRTSSEKFEKRSLVALGMSLQSLKDQRIISDYSINSEIDKIGADSAIRTAEKLIEKCNQMTRTEAP
ncbi:TPA: hypothetical protein ACV98Q_000732 [Yersinia enterocolitica]|uniref:hypothetical protein n=1 Tax=Yersinia enterocolitica TaxID=630 RepID=UPI0029123426|nr:hypothetical protein [Yersinia enterocolitica]EKN6172267.1 hypothetical protein [Yersinia enterocolitica]HDL6896744.1 hypothetical protein [Yersinia enterocolitica]HDL7190931.1 hypothetical protein [Yersinia enterocolitica]HDL7364847.1 hypothetical protein [Yersinia enterocolitica]